MILDSEWHMVKVGGQVAYLSPNEYALLSCLHDHGGMATYEAICQHIWWGAPQYDQYNVYSLARQVRRRLKKNNVPLRIATVLGIGYRLAVLSSALSGSPLSGAEDSKSVGI